MRPIAAAPLVLALVPSAWCQYLAQDVPNDVIFVQGSATPQQQWVGDTMQMYEPGAIRGTTQADGLCGPLAGSTYFCGPTNSLSISQPGFSCMMGVSCPPGVWGHDEGVSVQLLPVSSDGRLLIFWGDSVTAYNAGAVPPTDYQTFNCGTGGGSCLGVDTVSLLSSSDVSNVPNCTYLQDLDNYLLGATQFLPTYTGGTGEGGNCPVAQYIVDTAHNGTSVPWAGFTYQHVSGLASGEDMLLGHTATGAFPINDVTHSDTDLFVVYVVETQPGNGSRQFATESILLYQENVSPSNVNATSMPSLTRAYTFSTVPTGTAIADAVHDTVTICTGAGLDPAWPIHTLWQGVAIGSSLTAPFPIQGFSGPSTLDVSVPGGSSLPSTGSTCAGATVPFAVVPVPDTAGAGRFMYAAPVVLSTSLIAQSGWAAGLPSGLGSGPVVCFWGADFGYRNSNVHLGCMAASTSTIKGASYGGGGVSAMYYLSGLDAGGNTAWIQGYETQAVPMLTSFSNQSGAACVGEVSVRWISPLARFLMTYGSAACGGLWFRTAANPWGPWTTESQFFPNDKTAGWMQRLVSTSTPAGTPNFNQGASAYLVESDGTTIINTAGITPPFNQYGNPYGPYQFPASTAQDNGDGTVSVFMNLSGYNGYFAWQMSAKFRKPASVRLSGKVLISPQVRLQ